MIEINLTFDINDPKEPIHKKIIERSIRAGKSYLKKIISNYDTSNSESAIEENINNRILFDYEKIIEASRFLDENPVPVDGRVHHEPMPDFVSPEGSFVSENKNVNIYWLDDYQDNKPEKPNKKHKTAQWKMKDKYRK